MIGGLTDCQLRLEPVDVFHSVFVSLLVSVCHLEGAGGGHPHRKCGVS